MLKSKLTENVQKSMTTLKTIIKDFDQLQYSQEDLQTTDKWGRYSQETNRSKPTRRFSQYELPSSRVNFEELAQIRFAQKSKEISKQARIQSPSPSPGKLIDLGNIQKIKAQVRQQLSHKKENCNPTTLKGQKKQVPPMKHKVQCKECVQLLCMGLSTKYCAKH